MLLLISSLTNFPTEKWHCVNHHWDLWSVSFWHASLWRSGFESRVHGSWMECSFTQSTMESIVCPFLDLKVSTFLEENVLCFPKAQTSEWQWGFLPNIEPEFSEALQSMLISWASLLLDKVLIKNNLGRDEDGFPEFSGLPPLLLLILWRWRVLGANQVVGPWTDNDHCHEWG